MNVRACNIVLLHTLFAVAAVPRSIEALLFKDFFGGNDSILFARLRCLIAVQRTGFEVGDFASYHKSFRDNSIMELAQAGTYQGAASIEEYVKFAYAGTSPFIGCCNDYIKQKLQFVGYENGQCEFLAFYARKAELIPNTTAAPLEPFQFVNALKLYLDFEERYIKRINVFFTDDFLRIIFDLFLNSANTRQFVCGVANGPCSSTLNITANASNLTCEEQLLTLPSADGLYYVDGKSQGCRALHAAFAATNPVNHCAHLSYAPLEDPHGNIKCQTSKGTLPSSLFTERELQMFNDFATSLGIDPVLGHTHVG
jgi:hypothetical protein